MNQISFTFSKNSFLLRNQAGQNSTVFYAQANHKMNDQLVIRHIQFTGTGHHFDSYKK
jgi:hypothetical protein